MSRNDGVLYSGASSAAFTTPRANATALAKQKASQDRDQTRTKLQPEVQELNDLISAYEKSLMAELAQLTIGMDVTPERVIAELRAIQMNLTFVKTFRISVNNLMRKSA